MAELYEVLNISPSATDEEVKKAYRRRSLETHPDRFPIGSTEQEEGTAKFQEVNYAYFVLSDPGRRRDYDSQKPPKTGKGGGYGSSGPKDPEVKAEHQFNKEFKHTFEEMMGEEGFKEGHQNWCGIWGLFGGGAGAILGFIIANIPGTLAGAVAGYWLGRIRDVRKRAVYEVFQELPHAEKARLLSGLLAKVVSAA